MRSQIFDCNRFFFIDWKIHKFKQIPGISFGILMKFVFLVGVFVRLLISIVWYI